MPFAKEIFSVFAFIFATIFMLVLVTQVSFGQEVVIPDVDPIAALVDLIKNWKATTPITIGMTLVTVLVQALKKFAPGFKYTRLAVAALSAVYGTLLAVTEGLGWADGAIFALLTGGGAVAIYEAWKGVSKTVANGVAEAVRQ